MRECFAFCLFYFDLLVGFRLGLVGFGGWFSVLVVPQHLYLAV